MKYSEAALFVILSLTAICIGIIVVRNIALNI